jgi:glycine cleavage system H protein
MESLLSISQNVLIVIIGLVVRFLIAVIGLAVVLAPIVLALGLWKKLRVWRDHTQGLDQAGPIKWLRDAHYAPWHTWLQPAGAGLAKLGIDALAQQLLGRVTAIEIAAPGTQLRAGDVLARVACGDRTTTLRAPADSLVVAINDEVRRTPSLLHRDPYHRGWLAVAAPSARSFARLRQGEPARTWLSQEEHRLQLACEHALGYMAADGGDLVTPAHEMMPAEEWDALTREFLEAPAEDEPRGVNQPSTH